MKINKQVNHLKDPLFDFITDFYFVINFLYTSNCESLENHTVVIKSLEKSQQASTSFSFV